MKVVDDGRTSNSGDSSWQIDTSTCSRYQLTSIWLKENADWAWCRLEDLKLVFPSFQKNHDSWETMTSCATPRFLLRNAGWPLWRMASSQCLNCGAWLGTWNLDVTHIQRICSGWKSEIHLAKRPRNKYKNASFPKIIYNLMFIHLIHLIGRFSWSKLVRWCPRQGGPWMWLDMAWYGLTHIIHAACLKKLTLAVYFGSPISWVRAESTISWDFSCWSIDPLPGFARLDQGAHGKFRGQKIRHRFSNDFRQLFFISPPFAGIPLSLWWGWWKSSVWTRELQGMKWIVEKHAFVRDGIEGLSCFSDDVQPQ